MTTTRHSHAADGGGRAAVERAAGAAERPIRGLVGSGRANPLPHSGTISVFLLVVVVLSGVYITLFFEYGFQASYEAVADIDEHPIQRTVRSIHRYSSAALVLTTLVHAWRIFVAGRFTAGRRFRWLTGVAALAIVWLAGVTGYWLVWDQRAQAISESVDRTIGGFGWGARLVVDHLIGSGAGSGAGLTVLIWFVHVLLTAVIGWFLWRHLRGSRLAWWPPRHWMVAMGAGLLLLAVVLPADLLDGHDPAALVPDMSLDPFVLFLLPPLLGDQALLIAAVAAAALTALAIVPWLLRDRSVAVVAIDGDACTGCELCVVDCPYLALTMRDREIDAAGTGRIAVVDSAACVGCGICIGSCSFGAMELPGHTGVEVSDPDGRPVVIACRRQTRASGDLEDDVALVEVACTGMLHPAAVGDLVRKGAMSVQVVGCAPGDCSYGVGNTITHERLAGDRSPHVPRRYEGLAAEDYIAVGELAAVADMPGTRPDPDATHLPGARRSRVAAAGVVGASLVGIGAATLLPFGGDSADAAVRVVVDHDPGRQMIGQAEPTGTPGTTTEVVVEVDGILVQSTTVPTSGGTAIGVVDAPVRPGPAELRVVLLEAGAPTVLYDGPATFAAGRRFLLEARDIPPPPGVREGRKVFTEPRLGGCTVCHSTSPGDDGVGPTLAGVATRAAVTVRGLTAEEYLYESVIDPEAHVVTGWPAGQMLPIYEDRLSADEIDSLVRYLLTLEETG